MNIFPFRKAKDFFSVAEKEQIVHAIQHAEKETSGEIRVFVESKNYLVDPLERAGEIFFDLKMDETVHRNAVLLYIAVKHHEVALFADEGIYQKLSSEFWNNTVNEMIGYFKNEKLKDGMIHCIHKIGNTLKEKFPYDQTDKNELPDDIVFGK